MDEEISDLISEGTKYIIKSRTQVGWRYKKVINYTCFGDKFFPGIKVTSWLLILGLLAGSLISGSPILYIMLVSVLVIDFIIISYYYTFRVKHVSSVRVPKYIYPKRKKKLYC